MATLREAAQQALGALNGFISKELTVGQRYTNDGQALLDSITALRTALAEPEQEPVAWMYERDGKTHLTLTDQRPVEQAHPHFNKSTPLYTHPAPQPVTLTDEDIDGVALAMPGGLDGFLKGWGWRQFARAVIEAYQRKQEGKV